jgi:NhaP-type Na+/H+ or K+/H+ antiporter
LSYLCEAFILIYLGLSFDSFTVNKQMITYACADFFVLLVCRMICVFSLTYIARLMIKGSKGLRSKEALLIAFAGLIRGSIAYALIVKLANGDDM